MQDPTYKWNWFFLGLMVMIGIAVILGVR